MIKLLPAALLSSAFLFAAAPSASACDGQPCQVQVQPGHWTLQTKRVQVEGRWVYENQTVTVPGHWQTTTQTVTVPGRWDMVNERVRVPVRDRCHACSGVSFGNRHFRVNLGGCNHRTRYTYKTVCKRVWIPACTEQRPVRTWVPACERVQRVRVWKPACWETKQVRVWIPARTVSVCTPQPRRTHRRHHDDRGFRAEFGLPGVRVVLDR